MMPPEARNVTPLIKSSLIVSGLASKLVEIVFEVSYLTPAIMFNGLPYNSVSILTWKNTESKSSAILSFESTAPEGADPPAPSHAARASSTSTSK